MNRESWVVLYLQHTGRQLINGDQVAPDRFSPFFFPSFPGFFSLIFPGLVSFSENLYPDASMKLPEPDVAGDAVLFENISKRYE
jgi:hypothetical protein